MSEVPDIDIRLALQVRVWSWASDPRLLNSFVCNGDMSDTFQNTLTLEYHTSVPVMLFISLLLSPSAPRGLAWVELLLAYMATGVEFA